MSCVNEQNQHVGRLKRIHSSSQLYDTEIVIRWCPECGAVSTDIEVDGRLMQTDLQFPKKKETA